MNSSSMYDKKDSRCAFGIKLETQMKNLDDMERIVNTMRFSPRPGSRNRCMESKPFMDGIK